MNKQKKSRFDTGKPPSRPQEQTAHAPKGKNRRRADSAPPKNQQRVRRAEKRQNRDDQRQAAQGVLLWGLHAVREAWMNPQRACHRLLVTEAGLEAMSGTIAAAVLENLRRPSPTRLDRHDLERLLPPNSVHQGVAVDVAPLAEKALHDILKVSEEPDLLIVLDQVTDPHNIGAILRSAAAFGASAVIMTERNAPATTGVLAKTACGAVEHVPLIHVTNLARALDDLQEAGYWCIGLAEEAQKNLGELDLSARTALVLGAEGEGLRRLTRESCDELARLPTSGPIGSLNVSNAAAIALYEARKQKMKFG